MRVRSLAALSVAAVSLLALAGCASSAEPDASATPTTQAAVELCDSAKASGAISDAVSVTGAVGQAPTVSFTTPLDVTSEQATTVVEGSGDVIADGDYVTYGYAGYDPSTGENVSPYAVSGTPAPVVANSILGDAFGCAPVGTRAVITIPAGSSTAAAVYVIDLLSAVPADQWCAPVEPTEGAAFPTVVFGDDGSPTVTVPSADAAPTAVTEQVLTAGDGETVQAGDSVTVDYQGVKWSDGSVFDSSWQRGSAATFTTTQVVAGFGNALVGQNVGSTVLVVIPPECGYGTAATSNGLGGETLVFVVEIEGTAQG